MSVFWDSLTEHSKMYRTITRNGASIYPSFPTVSNTIGNSTAVQCWGRIHPSNQDFGMILAAGPYLCTIREQAG